MEPDPFWSTPLSPAAIPPDAILALAVVLVVALLAGALLMHRLLRTLKRQRQLARARQGRRGEALARRLLLRQGYVIEGEQVGLEYRFTCDSKPVCAGLRVDFVVRRGTARFVAEVKTGTLVSSLRHGPTRRQLLEYQCAFETNGVLLVDATVGTIHHIKFHI